MKILARKAWAIKSMKFGLLARQLATKPCSPEDFVILEGALQDPIPYLIGAESVTSEEKFRTDLAHYPLEDLADLWRITKNKRILMNMVDRFEHAECMLKHEPFLLLLSQLKGNRIEEAYLFQALSKHLLHDIKEQDSTLITIYMAGIKNGHYLKDFEKILCQLPVTGATLNTSLKVLDAYIKNGIEFPGSFGRLIQEGMERSVHSKHDRLFADSFKNNAMRYFVLRKDIPWQYRCDNNVEKLALTLLKNQIEEEMDVPLTVAMQFARLYHKEVPHISKTINSYGERLDVAKVNTKEFLELLQFDFYPPVKKAITQGILTETKRRITNAAHTKEELVDFIKLVPLLTKYDPSLTGLMNKALVKYGFHQEILHLLANESKKDKTLMPLVNGYLAHGLLKKLQDKVHLAILLIDEGFEDLKSNVFDNLTKTGIDLFTLANVVLPLKLPLDNLYVQITQLLKRNRLVSASQYLSTVEDIYMESRDKIRDPRILADFLKTLLDKLDYSQAITEPLLNTHLDSLCRHLQYIPGKVSNALLTQFYSNVEKNPQLAVSQLAFLCKYQTKFGYDFAFKWFYNNWVQTGTGRTQIEYEYYILYRYFAAEMGKLSYQLLNLVRDEMFEKIEQYWKRKNTFMATKLLGDFLWYKDFSSKRVIPMIDEVVQESKDVEYCLAQSMPKANFKQHINNPSRVYFAEKSLRRIKDYKVMLKHFVSLGEHGPVPEQEFICQELCRFVPSMDSFELNQVLQVTLNCNLANLPLLEQVYRKALENYPESKELVQTLTLNAAFLRISEEPFFTKITSNTIKEHIKEVLKSQLLYTQNKEELMLAALTCNFIKIDDLAKIVGALESPQQFTPDKLAFYKYAEYLVEDDKLAKHFDTRYNKSAAIECKKRTAEASNLSKTLLSLEIAIDSKKPENGSIVPVTIQNRKVMLWPVKRNMKLYKNKKLNLMGYIEKQMLLKNTAGCSLLEVDMDAFKKLRKKEMKILLAEHGIGSMDI